jgi:tetratricopeptide (TPR) repeat protein
VALPAAAPKRIRDAEAASARATLILLFWRFAMNGIRVSLLFLFLSVCHSETLHVVRGRVLTDVAYLGTDIMAELDDVDRHAPPNRAQVNVDGSFEFRDVMSGRHTLRLMTLFGDTICEQSVEVFTFGGELSIRLPKQSSERPAGAMVSVRELQRPVPPKAFRALAEAQRESESGRTAEAIRKLELALRLHPDYSAAHCNLGVEYVRLGRHREALEQFEKAAATGAPTATLYGNLSFAYFAVGRLQDAEHAARRAVSLDARYIRAHYLLGSILAHGVRPGALEKAPEAARHLRLGAPDIPRAHIEIAQIYLAEGDQLGAAEEFRQYLKTGDPGYRAPVEHWLTTFQKK